jgi:hypothetical protein
MEDEEYIVLQLSVPEAMELEEHLEDHTSSEAESPLSIIRARLTELIDDTITDSDIALQTSTN